MLRWLLTSSRLAWCKELHCFCVWNRKKRELLILARNLGLRKFAKETWGRKKNVEKLFSNVLTYISVEVFATTSLPLFKESCKEREGWEAEARNGAVMKPEFGTCEGWTAICPGNLLCTRPARDELRPSWDWPLCLRLSIISTFVEINSISLICSCRISSFESGIRYLRI